MHFKSRFLGAPSSVDAGGMHSNFLFRIRMEPADAARRRGHADPPPRTPKNRAPQKPKSGKLENNPSNPISQPRTQPNRTPTRCKVAEPVHRIDGGPERKQSDLNLIWPVCAAWLFGMNGRLRNANEPF